MTVTIQHTRLNKYAKIVFVYFLLLYLYRINSHSLLISTYNQPIKCPGTDYTFWLAHLLQFPDFIISHYWLCVFIDVSIALITICCIFSDKKRFIFSILLFILFFFQRISIESYSCSHTKSISCLFIAILPFCFKKESNAELMIEFSRYFLIYILIISAYSKYHDGALFNVHNFSNVLIHQHMDVATLHPSHISYRIAAFLIKNPLYADIAFYCLFIVQLSFIIAVFTKKFDKFLFILLFGFAVTTYFIMRIYNFDITVLGLSLLYFSPQKVKQDDEK